LIVTQWPTRDRSGLAGVFQPTTYVNLLEKPASLDRSQGDIHAGGNPHIQGDPRNMLPVSKRWPTGFASSIRPNAASLPRPPAAFAANGRRPLNKWAAEAARCAASRSPYSTELVYLENWVGRAGSSRWSQARRAASSGYLAQVLEVLKKTR